MAIPEYISEIQKQYATGVAREHSYRPALQTLLAMQLCNLMTSDKFASHNVCVLTV